MSMAVAFVSQGLYNPRELLICISFGVETSNRDAFMTVQQVGAWEYFLVFMLEG